jgi:hypothetical protein
MTVKEYTEDFYKLNIRTGQREKYEEKVVRYINGMRYEIQDEINIMSVRTMEDAYQFSLKAEENLDRKQNQQGRGRTPTLNKGKGVSMTRHINPKTRLRNQIVTRKEEEVLEEDRVVE